MYLSYVVENTNRMGDLLHLEPDIQDLAKAASIGCTTLQHIEHDDELFTDIERLQSLHWHHLDHFQSMLHDTYKFSEEFLPQERKALLKAGLHSEIVEGLLSESFSLRNKAAQDYPSAETLRVQVLRLRQFTCPLAVALKEEVLSQIKKSKQKQVLSRVMWGIAGTAMIGVNAGGLALSAGLSTPVALVSGALGGAFVTKAVESLKEEGGKTMQAGA